MCKKTSTTLNGLEMGFYDNRLKKHGKGYKLTDYIRVFDKHKVWETMDAPYYEGGDAFYKLYYSAEEEYNKLHLSLANINANRQKGINRNKD